MHVESRTLPAPSAVLEARLEVVVLILVAVIVRIAVVGATVGFHTLPVAEPASDSRIHITIVENLLKGRGFSLWDGPTAITPPLYVFFLAALYAIFDAPVAVRCIQAALGAVGVAMIYSIGRRLFGHRTGILAAVGLSLHPLAAYLSGLHLTENLFLFLILGVIWQSLRLAERPSTPGALFLGAVVGLAALTRSIFLAFLPFVLLWTVILWGPRTGRAYGLFALIAGAALLVILPWTVRNYFVLREFIPIQSNAGMVFWAGNNAHADGGMVLPTRKTWPDVAPPDDEAYGWRRLSIAQENERYVRAAVTWIRAHPGDAAVLTGKKLARLYGLTRATDEQGAGAPTLFLLVQAGVYATAAAGLLLSLSRWRAVSLLIAFVAFTNATVMIFSGGTRYIVPMLPSLLLFSSFAVATAWNRLAPQRDAA